MSSVQSLREFISERLTAAAEEIFTEFEKTIVQYEEEIDRQRRLLDITWKPQTHLHTTELPQRLVWKKNEVLTEQQLWNQERNSNLDQEEPEPPQIEDDQEEPEHPVQEPKLPQIKDNQEESEPPQIEDDQEEPELLQIKEELEEELLLLKQETETEERKSCEPDSNRDQLLCQNFSEAENQDKEGCRNYYLKLTRRSPQTRGEGVAASNQKTHKDVHAGENLFPCKICGRCFNRKNDLSNHMRAHKSQKPLSCPTCGKTFNQKCNLITHVRVHTGEKPYSCEVCGKCFAQSNNLTTHMRTHSGLKSSVKKSAHLNSFSLEWP